MKAKKDLRKTERSISSDSDDLKLNRKLQPVKKDKNVKRALFQEIDEFEDLETGYLRDELNEEIAEDEEE